MDNSIASHPLFQQQQQGVDIKSWLFRLKRLIPWFILSFIIFLGVAWLYLRYTEPTFRSTASVLIRNTDKEEDPSLKDLNMINPGKVIENEIKVLKSPDLMKEVVLNESLYADIKIEGGTMEGNRTIYKDDFPLSIKIINPNLIASSISFHLLWKANKWMMAMTKMGNATAIDTSKIYNIGKIQVNFASNAKYTGKQELLVPSYMVILTPIDQVTRQYVSALSVNVSGKTSSVIDLSLMDENPTNATTTLSALLNIYNRKSLEEKNTAGDNILKFLNERLGMIKEDLNQVEGTVQQYKSGNQITDVSGAAAQYVSAFSELDQQKAQQLTQLNLLNGLEREIATRQNNPSVIMSSMGVSDPTLNGLIERYNIVMLNAERLKKTAGDLNPGLIDYQTQMEDLRTSIGANIRNIKSTYNTSFSDLIRKSAEVGSRIRTMPKMEKDLGQITRDHSVQEQIYLFLLQKREERSMTLAANISDARTIVEPTSIGKIAPVETTIWGAAFILALMLPIGMMLLKDAMNNKVGDRREIMQKTIVPVIGEIAHVKKIKNPLVINAQAHTLVAENFRSLRTELNHKGKAEMPKTILITSEGLGEGKSFISLNLAVSYALLNRKVVVLEFDLRRPGLASAIGLQTPGGITNYLGDAGTLDHLLTCVPETNNNLFLLSSGPATNNPSELIASHRMDTLMKELKERFDYIIIDTPPIGLVTDAKLLKEFADVTLFVLRQDYTDKDIYSILNQRQIENPEQLQYIVLNAAGKTEKKHNSNTYNVGYYDTGNKGGKKTKLKVSIQ